MAIPPPSGMRPPVLERYFAAVYNPEKNVDDRLHEVSLIWKEVLNRVLQVEIGPFKNLDEQRHKLLPQVRTANEIIKSVNTISSITYGERRATEIKLGRIALVASILSATYNGIVIENIESVITLHKEA